MKQSIYILLLSFIAWGCSYDDSLLTERVDNLENRMAALERVCQTVNENIEGLQTVIDIVESNAYITGITPIEGERRGERIGYTLTFSSGESIHIYDGTDGEDGHTPIIGVEKDTDDILYWTLDGEWLLNDGKKVAATVVGEQGEKGASGQNGITPKLKIEINADKGNIPYWYVSYDNGENWTELYRATGNDGNNGKDGEDGTDGDTLFKNIKLAEDGNSIILTLNDASHTTYTIPVASNTIAAITFVPEYNDGKASVTSTNGECYIIEADFKLFPAGQASQLVADWTNGTIKITADYIKAKNRPTNTRAVELSEMKVLSVVAQQDNNDVVSMRLGLPQTVTVQNEEIFFSVSINGTTSTVYIPIISDKLDVAYHPDANVPVAVKDGLMYVWGDEFNKEGKPDSQLWGYEIGFIRGNEKQYYQEDNANVTGGRLLISGREERVRNINYDPTSGDYRKNTEYSEITSASINGKGKRLFLYGRTEVRARITKKNGSFPAIWTCGINRDWPQNGEIDIMEFYWNKGASKYVFTSNFCVGGDQNGNDGYWAQNWKSSFTDYTYYTAKDEDWINKYHVYRMDWNEKTIKLYVDDEFKNEVDVTSFKNWDGTICFHNPQFMMLNLAIKDNGEGSIDVDGQQFEVDYFRIYQKFNDLIPPTVPKNLIAVSSAHSVRLSWEPSEDEHFYRYDIYCNGLDDGYWVGSTSESTGGDGSTVNETSFTVTQTQPGNIQTQRLQPDTEYTFYVRALDYNGNYSEPTSITVRTGTDTSPESGSSYRIVSYHSGKVLVPGIYTDSEGNKTECIVQKAFTGAENEVWEISKSTLLGHAEHYIFKNKKDGSLLYYQWVDSGSQVNGDVCITYRTTDAESDWWQPERGHWILVSPQDEKYQGLYMIKNEFGGDRYLDVNSASIAENMKIIFWEGNLSQPANNRLWYFEKVAE